jgi:phosphate transport system permease protein
MARTTISKPPSGLDVFFDRSFRGLTLAFAWLTILLVAYIVWEVGGKAAPAIQKYGLSFLTSTTWDANKGQFGVLPEIWGTLYSSMLALGLGGFFGVTIAIFLTQDFLPPRIEVVLKTII